MSAVLEFPPLIADEVIDAPAEAAPAVSKEVALATIRTTALSELSAVERGIAELCEKHGATDYDITTPKGYRLATERRHAIRQVRYKVPHVVKARKAELKEIGEAVGSEGERIIAALMAIESPHDAKITAEDTRREQEAERLRAVEAERVAGHRALIADIRECVGKCSGKTSERIANGIIAVEALVTDEATYQEFAQDAADAKTETLAAMRELFTAAKAAEDDAAAREAQRVEQARVAQEQAETQRRLDEARALIAKAERVAAEQIEAERKKLAAEKAAWLAEQQAAKAPPAAIAAPPAAPVPVAAVAIADPVSLGLEAVYPGAAVFYVNAAPSAPVAAEDPTLTIGDIKDRLAPLSITAEGLAQLGFAHAATKGAAKMYPPSAWQAIKVAIVKHIEGLAA